MLGDWISDVSGIYRSVTLGIKTALKPYIVWSLGPTALICESLDT